VLFEGQAPNADWVAKRDSGANTFRKVGQRARDWATGGAEGTETAPHPGG